MMILSAYERRARLTPGLFAVFPVVVTVLTLGLKRYPAVAVAASFLSAAGGSYLLAVVVARFGRSYESDLNAMWGGRATTQLLRFSGPANATQRKIWRSALTNLTGVRLLNEKQELADPTAADHAIEAAIDQVRYLGHGNGVLIVATENAQYGLERNLYGFRQIARLIALVCMVGLVVALWFPGHIARPADVVGLILDVAALLAWLVIPSADRVKEASLRYANQLLQAVVNQARGTGGAVNPKPTHGED